MSVSSRLRTFRMSLSRRTPMGHQVSFCSMSGVAPSPGRG